MNTEKYEREVKKPIGGQNMNKMDTTRSDKIVQDFLARNSLCKRKTMVFEKGLSAAPNDVFTQLCPAREADWINGWTVNLLYTETGYAEPLCVFSTPVSNIFGSGLWMITKMEPNANLEFVVFYEDKEIIEYTKIHLFDTGNKTCKVVFETSLTAISEKGNAVIESFPDYEPPFLDELDHFLKHGNLKGS
jgi:hypothetical protein